MKFYNIKMLYRIELPNYIEGGEIINKLSINDGIIKVNEYNYL